MKEIVDKPQEYELYQFHKAKKTSRYPDGIDQDSCTVGNAKTIIKWLLKFDSDMKGYKIVKNSR